MDKAEIACKKLLQKRRKSRPGDTTRKHGHSSLVAFLSCGSVREILHIFKYFIQEMIIDEVKEAGFFFLEVHMTQVLWLTVNVLLS